MNHDLYTLALFKSSCSLLFLGDMNLNLRVAQFIFRLLVVVLDNYLGRR
jgi:hypothetical protein